MMSPLLFPFALAVAALFGKVWLFRQDQNTRIFASLALLSIAMYMYGFALYGACHGEVDFLRNPAACTRAAPALYNPGAWRVSRLR